MKIAIVTSRTPSGEAGGAERFYDALVCSLQNMGHGAVEIPIVADESSFEEIQKNYLNCYDLDLAGYDLAISTKAPTWLIRHPRHVCYLVHTIRVFYDMFETNFPHPTTDHYSQQKMIHQLDTVALQPPHSRAVFTIGNEVSKRLKKYNGINSEALHPPLWSDRFREGPFGDYLFIPGRLHPWKRVDLIIDAMQHVTSSLRLLIAGTGESDATLKNMAKGDRRIEFLGRITDAELFEYYAGALAIPFTPQREDYGYITLEAFASGKPVITCTDSGEAAEIVQDGVSGFICEPDPGQIAKRIDWLYCYPEEARRFGQAGKSWVNRLSWQSNAQKLIDSVMK